MKIKPMHLMVAVVLCMTQMLETTTALQYQDDQNNSAELIPQDIMDKIAEYLKPSPEKLVPIMIFFSLNEEKITNRYIQTLRTVFKIDAAFRGVVDNLVKDTEKVNDNPEYHSVMATIWNYYLKNVDDPQFTFKSLLLDNSIKTSQQYKNLFTILSNIAPSTQTDVIKLAVALSPLTKPETTKSFNQNFDRLFQGTNLVSVAKYVQVGLVVTSLTLETYDSLNLWWKGEILGERCAKNVIDSCASVVGGIYGGMLGAAAVTYIAPGPAGTIIGGFAGGLIGSVATYSLSAWLTQNLFDLPQDVALENAYRFLELHHTASNDEINSNYNRLAWEYHSKESKNENVENWLKLQTCMDVIRTSKGQGLRDK